MTKKIGVEIENRILALVSRLALDVPKAVEIQSLPAEVLICIFSAPFITHMASPLLFVAA